MLPPVGMLPEVGSFASKIGRIPTSVSRFLAVYGCCDIPSTELDKLVCLSTRNEYFPLRSAALQNLEKAHISRIWKYRPVSRASQVLIPSPSSLSSSRTCFFKPDWARDEVTVKRQIVHSSSQSRLTDHLPETSIDKRSEGSAILQSRSVDRSHQDRRQTSD